MASIFVARSAMLLKISKAFPTATTRISAVSYPRNHYYPLKVSKVSFASSPNTGANENHRSWVREDNTTPLGHKSDDLKAKGREAMQEGLGITRQKADELKGEYENVRERTDDRIRDFGDVTKDNADRASGKAADKIDEIKDSAADKARDTTEKAEETLRTAGDRTKEIKDRAGDTVHRGKDKAGDLADELKHKSKEAAEKAGDALDRAGDRTEDAAQWTAHKAKEGTHKAAGVAGAVGDTAKEAVKGAWDAALGAGQKIKETVVGKDDDDRSIKSPQDYMEDHLNNPPETHTRNHHTGTTNDPYKDK